MELIYQQGNGKNQQYQEHFRDSEILILDEPTASLDPKIEYKIYQDFLNISENKTVIYVTHRLATVKFADKVLLLNNGKILGFEHHDTLYENNKYYKNLYDLQASIYQLKIESIFDMYKKSVKLQYKIKAG